MEQKTSIPHPGPSAAWCAVEVTQRAAATRRAVPAMRRRGPSSALALGVALAGVWALAGVLLPSGRIPAARADADTLATVVPVVLVSGYDYEQGTAYLGFYADTAGGVPPYTWAWSSTNAGVEAALSAAGMTGAQTGWAMLGCADLANGATLRVTVRDSRGPVLGIPATTGGSVTLAPCPTAPPDPASDAWATLAAPPPPAPPAPAVSYDPATGDLTVHHLVAVKTLTSLWATSPGQNAEFSYAETIVPAPPPNVPTTQGYLTSLWFTETAH